MNITVFYINISIKGYAAEILVNGAPVITSSMDFPRIAFPTVSQWVVQGTNTLDVTLDPSAAPPPPDDDPDSPIRLEVKLCRGDLGTVPDLEDEDEVCAVDTPPAPGIGGSPPRTRRRFEAKQPFGPFSWQFAERLKPDHATIASVTRYLTDLHYRLASRQFTAVLPDFADKNREVAACYGQTQREFDEDFLAAMNHLSSHPNWAIADLDPAGFDFRLCCQGRVVQLRNRDGKPSIRLSEPVGESDWSLPLFVARINGAFRVVR